jgi:hypothetical protein
MKELLTPGGEHHEIGDEGWLMMMMRVALSIIHDLLRVRGPTRR